MSKSPAQKCLSQNLELRSKWHKFPVHYPTLGNVISLSDLTRGGALLVAISKINTLCILQDLIKEIVFCILCNQVRTLFLF